MKAPFLKFLPIAAAVLLATSCSKDDNDNTPATESGRDGVHPVYTTGIPFTIRVNTGRSLKKMAYENGTEVGSYQPKFEQNDEDKLTMIIKDGDDVIGNLTLDDAKTATFSGSLTQQPSSNASLTAEITVTPAEAKTFSDKSLAALLATCAHTFLGTFNYGDENVDLTDQTSYLAITLPTDETTVNVNGNECALKNGKVWVAFNSSEKVHSARLSLFNKQADPGTIYTVTRGKSNFVAKEFTVADDGKGNVKKVYFSSGNLLYQASSQKWEFASRQWDCVGEADGNTTTANRDKNVAYIDLFGWGTGSNPTLAIANTDDYPEFVDWGKNIDDGNIWQTLSIDEWNHVIQDRENASDKCGVAAVAGFGGLVLLPDEWIAPDGVSFNCGVNHFFATNNDYSFADWQKMEKAGAVFLPAAGNRSGTSVDLCGYNGYYWSSDVLMETFAYNMYFNSVYVSCTDGDPRSYGKSVRLVRPAL
ncbi:MAG: hypothetical protein PUC50_10710 [Bacteroidales bacterium]|nr:hypothetical protein [Bacteroidales bacterium]